MKYLDEIKQFMISLIVAKSNNTKFAKIANFAIVFDLLEREDILDMFDETDIVALTKSNILNVLGRQKPIRLEQNDMFKDDLKYRIIDAFIKWRFGDLGPFETMLIKAELSKYIE